MLVSIPSRGRRCVNQPLSEYKLHATYHRFHPLSGKMLCQHISMEVI
jgi:hypothetical protein